MNKIINKKTAIAFLIAILLISIGKPVKAQWDHPYEDKMPKKDNTLLYVTLGVGTAVIIAAVVMIVKHNKTKDSTANLMLNKDFLILNDELDFNRKFRNIKTTTINNFGYIEQVKLNFKPMPIAKSILFLSTKQNGFSSFNQLKLNNNF